MKHSGFAEHVNWNLWKCLTIVLYHILEIQIQHSGMGLQPQAPTLVMRLLDHSILRLFLLLVFAWPFVILVYSTGRAVGQGSHMGGRWDELWGCSGPHAAMCRKQKRLAWVEVPIVYVCMYIYMWAMCVCACMHAWICEILIVYVCMYLYVQCVCVCVCVCYVRCVLSVPWSNTITLFSEHSSVSLGKLAQCRGQTLIDLQLLLEFGLIGGLFQL